MYRDYSDMDWARCEGLGDCKDDNSEDCTAFVDTVAAECGKCSYCEESSCVDYPDGTACGDGQACGSGDCVQGSTVLLLHMDDVNLQDSSGAGHGTAKHGGIFRSAAQSKFGGYSARLDGTGYLSIEASVDWYLPEDWTVDFWMYDQQPSASWHAPMSIGSGYPKGGIEILIQSHKIYVSDGTTHYDQFGGGSEISANTWYHIAVVKQGSTLSLYKNGALVQSRSNSKAYGGNVASYVGIEHPCICYYFNGYLDEFRVSKGVARWTKSFDPPDQPY